MQRETQRSAYPSAARGRWVTERAYAEWHGLSKQTLTNWRWRDRKAGLSEAAAGYPQYRRFGRAVRYWLPSEDAV